MWDAGGPLVGAPGGGIAALLPRPPALSNVVAVARQRHQVLEGSLGPQESGVVARDVSRRALPCDEQQPLLRTGLEGRSLDDGRGVVGDTGEVLRPGGDLVAHLLHGPTGPTERLSVNRPRRLLPDPPL